MACSAETDRNPLIRHVLWSGAFVLAVASAVTGAEQPAPLPYAPLIRQAVPLPQQEDGFSPQGVAMWTHPAGGSRLLVTLKRPDTQARLVVTDPEDPRQQQVLLVRDAQGGDGPMAIGGCAAVSGAIILVGEYDGGGHAGVVTDAEMAAALASGNAIVPRWVPVQQRASASCRDGDLLWLIAFVRTGDRAFRADRRAAVVTATEPRPRGTAFRIADLLAWTPGQPGPQPQAEAAWPWETQGAAIVGGQVWVARSWSTDVFTLDAYSLEHLRAGRVDPGHPTIRVAVPPYIEGLWAGTAGDLWTVFEGGTPARRATLTRAGLPMENRAVRLDLARP